MCVVSMVGDHYNDKWRLPDYWREHYPSLPGPTISPKQPEQQIPLDFDKVSRVEFEALKREVQEMKALLERAVEYDKRNNEPHCEVEDKVALLKKVAEMVGVDLKDVFSNEV